MDGVELDRLRELANIGAGHAANAFSQLVQRTILMRVPEVRVLGEAPVDAAHGEGAAFSAGVFFELEGCLDARVCILFRDPERDRVVRQMLGGARAEPTPSMVESVLHELGNILASHLASAIADTVGDRLLPSVPRLALCDVEHELDLQLLDGSEAKRVRIDCELHDCHGELGALIVVVPDLASCSA